MQRRNQKKPAWLLVVVGAIALVAIMYYLFSWRPSNDYKAAKALYNEGNYEKAAIKFLALGNYADAKMMAQEAEQQFLDSMNTPTLTLEPTPKSTRIMRQTDEINDSWEEIIAAIDDGTVKQRYAVGATKELDLGELGTVHMQLAGFDLDECADGLGKAATAWIAVELLPEKRPMNQDYLRKGGWRDSDLRRFLQHSVRAVLPETIRKRLVSVRKQQREGSEWQTTADELWVPDYDEMFGEESLYGGLFMNREKNCKKTLAGSGAWWWLRSADYFNFFNGVNFDGSIGNYGAGGSGGVALSFCL